MIGKDPVMTIADDIITLRKLVPEHRVAMLTTRAPSGELHSRPVKTQEIDDQGRFWFLVSAASNWVAGLAADEPVNLGFTDDDERTWVSVAGAARLLEDRARVDRYRADGDAGHRIDDADVRLLEVTPSTVEYWDAPSGKIQALAVKAARVIGKSDSTVGSSGTLDI